MRRTLSGAPARFEGGVQEVAPGVYAWLQPNGSWGESNAGLVAGDGEALLVDTLWDPRLARRMLDALPDIPITTVVNTHSDGDHCWGNQCLAGAEIVATRTAARIIREDPPAGLQRFKAMAPWLRRLPERVPGHELGAYVERMLAPFDFAAVKVTPPTREFDGELTLHAGGREVRLIEVGPAHTAGDAIVHVPDAGVVLAADILFVGVLPVMWAGPTANWLRALDRVLELAPAAIVPGHGPVCGSEEAGVVREHLAWLQEAGESRLARGRSVPEVARELLASPEHRESPWAAWQGPERIVITLTTIDRHRRGAAGPVGARERARIFAQVAELAAELSAGT